MEHLNSVHCLLSCMAGQNFTKRQMRPRKLTTLSNEPFLSALWLAPLSVMGLACFTWCQIETRRNSNTGKRKEAHYERVALATNTGHSLLYNQRQIYCEHCVSNCSSLRHIFTLLSHTSHPKSSPRESTLDYAVGTTGTTSTTGGMRGGGGSVGGKGVNRQHKGVDETKRGAI